MGSTRLSVVDGLVDALVVEASEHEAVLETRTEGAN
jgi:hypothetical protein